MSSLDEILQRHGGRWDPGQNTELSRLVEVNTRRIRKIQDANFASLRPPMEFLLINNGSFNAFATRHGQTDIIAMHMGLVLILNNLFQAIMSHPEVMPKVGNRTVEKTSATMSNNSTSIFIRLPRRRLRFFQMIRSGKITP